MKTDQFSNQLRWVILLLAAAVILPTVCLLWFMNQAVTNYRLAVRQALINSISKDAKWFFVDIPNNALDDYFKRLELNAKTEPHLVFESVAGDTQSLLDGILIYDANGDLLFPPVEFLNDDILEDSDQPLPDIRNETTERIYELCYPENPLEIPPSRAADIMRYRVFLAKRLQEKEDPDLIYHLRKMLINRNDHSDKKNWFLNGPAETMVWQLKKMIEIAQDSGLASRLGPEIQSAHNRIIAYNNASEAAYFYPSAASLDNWPDRTVRRIAPTSDLYGIKFKHAGKTILGVSGPDRMLAIFPPAVSSMPKEITDVSVTDNLGSVVAGNENLTEKPFLTVTAGNYFPEFTVSFFFKDNSVFENAANRQTTIYIWTGLLVALLVLSAGAISIRAVNHQIKMNRLKNDFIATVTHELKTPLASMRLLVDTLLEGSYEGEQTATEYLQLVAKENKRLTHLIDSFLTFSRMERNKQVFEIAAVSPVQIAKTAAEAVGTRFENGNVRFSLDIQKHLPMIHADADGIITVLVNLLDNAYKYTNGDKQIDLNVYEQDGFVCFAVTDNGIGLGARAQKKIFNRFYQVDSRLSRRAEGCGLGLSIVKFIVDAHKGSIEVESQLGRGSTFTVKLPKI
ncbi:MAG: sensor histidine kinase [Planctomycetota bacterium]